MNCAVAEILSIFCPMFIRHSFHGGNGPWQLNTAKQREGIAERRIGDRAFAFCRRESDVARRRYCQKDRAAVSNFYDVFHRDNRSRFV